jgi:hypothetical protein
VVIDLPQPALSGTCDARKVANSRRQHGAHSMMDILMLALVTGLFAAGIGYAYVCERL